LQSRPSSAGLKIAFWLLAALPLLDLLLLTLTDRLGVHPQETLLRATGTWSLTLLLVTLAVSPCCRWLQWPALMGLRRMLGLWAFAYLVIHLSGFLAFEHDFRIGALFKDALTRPFVTVGLAAFLLMLPMALTSFRGAQMRLGANWKRIHRMIYAIAGLACLHFFLHRAGKNNFADPVWALMLTLVLLAARLRWLGIQKWWNTFSRN
jgi:sulfoxide reductase heme-binding subunit YedZ